VLLLVQGGGHGGGHGGHGGHGGGHGGGDGHGGVHRGGVTTPSQPACGGWAHSVSPPKACLIALDPPPINNGNRCNGKHGDGQEDGADEDGEEVVVRDLVPRLHDGVGGEVVERADGVARVAAQRGRSLRRPEVGV